MQWIRDFDLFLFDFDGLLVNSEHLHYSAYVNMMAKRGYKLGLSFANFCELAHRSSSAWREALYAQFPDLEPNWALLYAEKKQIYEELLLSGKVELMPGVTPLLQALEKENKRRCVVTHSFLEQTKLIRAHQKVLETIPWWVTRECYEKPKPSPECYLKAIALYGKKGDRIIGFEDSLRGLQALKGTPALPVLICPHYHPLIEIAMSEGGPALYFESLVVFNFH